MISMKYFLNLDFHQLIKLFLICKRNKKSKVPKGSIKLNKSLKRQTTVDQNKKSQPVIHQTQHRKLKIELHKPHQKLGVNSGAPEG